MADKDTAATEGWEKLRAEAHVWLLRPEGLGTSKRQQEFLATNAFCRGVLSRYAAVEPGDWAFRRGDFGKPKIEGEFAELRFNLSRTAGLLACIVSRAGEVGMDVEETTRPVDVERVVRHFFSREERNYLAGLPTEQREAWFFERWVL
jgi:4'-phosphopantetheinyl transferase